MEAFLAFGKLVLTLGVLVGALLYVRRWAQRGGAAGRHAAVKVAARTALTRGSVVAVVDIGQRRFLVGAGDQQVTLLAELEPPADGADDELSLAGMPGAARSEPRPRPGGAHLFTPPATDAQAHATTPWIGLVDRLRARTVRTHVEGPIRALDD